MTDRQLSDGVDDLLAITRAQGLPDELVHALVALLDLYVQRVTMIVAQSQVHDLRAREIPPPGHSDPDSYTGRD